MYEFQQFVRLDLYDDCLNLYLKEKNFIGYCDKVQ